MAEELYRRFNNELCPCLDMLAARWSDEKEYEDFAEYRKVVDNLAAKFPGVMVTKMTKRPFAVHYTVEGLRYETKISGRRILTSVYRPKAA